MVGSPPTLIQKKRRDKQNKNASKELTLLKEVACEQEAFHTTFLYYFSSFSLNCEENLRNSSI